MFSELHKLASDGNCKLLLSLAANGPKLIVNVTPLPSGKDASAALSVPLKLEGTPQELDEQFASILSSYAGKRQSLQQALEDAQAIMDAAKQEATQQAVQGVSKGGVKTAPAATATTQAATGDATTSAPSAATDAEVALF